MDLREHRVRKGCRVIKDLRVLLELRDHKDCKVFKEMQALKVLRDPRDRLEPMEPMDLMGRRCSMESRILTLAMASMETSTSTRQAI